MKNVLTLTCLLLITMQCYSQSLEVQYKIKQQEVAKTEKEYLAVKRQLEIQRKELKTLKEQIILQKHSSVGISTIINYRITVKDKPILGSKINFILQPQDTLIILGYQDFHLLVNSNKGIGWIAEQHAPTTSEIQDYIKKARKKEKRKIEKMNLKLTEDTNLD